MRQQHMKRFYREGILGLGVLWVTLFASALVFRNYELPITAQFVITLTPLIPMMFIVIAFFRLIKNSDELVQRVHLQAFAISSITIGLVAFGYGLLESIGVSDFPSIWTLPAMLILWTISTGFLWKRYQ